MRAVLTCVDFADLLAVTLPYNQHHFESVTVVTTPTDLDTQSVAHLHHADLYLTNTFYRYGPNTFAKWAALEEALDHIGRYGWLCLMDADVLWPHHILGETTGLLPWLVSGNLYTPARRVLYPLDKMYAHQGERVALPPTKLVRLLPFPPEDQWGAYPIHPNQGEFAGYSQIFHASDPHLPVAPWHETNWIHAGGADSIFQSLWPTSYKVRPPFEVLHLGEAGANWFGRATPYLNGSLPEDSEERRERVRSIWLKRRGKVGQDRFHGERI